MKKLFFTLIILILYHLNVHSQSGWFWQNPLPQGNDLYDICRNELNGMYYACGAYGTIVSQSVGNRCTLFNASNYQEEFISIEYILGI